jgi:hypothetical protein
MRSPTAFACAPFLLLHACVAGDPAAVGTSDQALIGSPQGPTIAATVVLHFQDPSGALNGSCSGTALTDHVILTAAHCIDRWPAGERVNVLRVDRACQLDEECLASCIESCGEGGHKPGPCVPMCRNACTICS